MSEKENWNVYVSENLSSSVRTQLESLSEMIKDWLSKQEVLKILHEFEDNPYSQIKWSAQAMIAIQAWLRFLRFFQKEKVDWEYSSWSTVPAVLAFQSDWNKNNKDDKIWEDWSPWSETIKRIISSLESNIIKDNQCSKSDQSFTVNNQISAAFAWDNNLNQSEILDITERKQDCLEKSEEERKEMIIGAIVENVLKLKYKSNWEVFFEWESSISWDYSIEWTSLIYSNWANEKIVIEWDNKWNIVIWKIVINISEILDVIKDFLDWNKYDDIKIEELGAIDFPDYLVSGSNKDIIVYRLKEKFPDIVSVSFLDWRINSISFTTYSITFENGWITSISSNSDLDFANGSIISVLEDFEGKAYSEIKDSEEAISAINDWLNYLWFNSVEAFQREWNSENPNDKIKPDNAPWSQTISRLIIELNKKNWNQKISIPEEEFNWVDYNWSNISTITFYNNWKTRYIKALDWKSIGIDIWELRLKDNNVWEYKLLRKYPKQDNTIKDWDDIEENFIAPDWWVLEWNIRWFDTDWKNIKRLKFIGQRLDTIEYNNWNYKFYWPAVDTWDDNNWFVKLK